MILYDDDIERLKKIQEYIHSNLDEDLRVKVLAQKFFIDKYKLGRHFTKQFGLPIHNYIMKQRMIKAHELLLNKTMPICQVAMQVGYNDRSSFSHAFSTYYGVPPKNLFR